MKKMMTGLLIGVLTAYSSPAQPNQPVPVIIIMADQLRFDVPDEYIPNISRLRGESVVFDRAYCASPICVPSRSAFFTGLYPNRNGALVNPWHVQDASFGMVKAGTPNLYTLMEERWDSRHVGKQHLLTEERLDETGASSTKWVTPKAYDAWMKSKKMPKPGGRDFKAKVPETVSGATTYLKTYSIPYTAPYEPGLAYFPDHFIGNESVAAIRNRDRNKPLLLNAMFLAPHPPFHIPEPYFSMVSEASVKLPDDVGVWYDGQSPLQMYNITGFLGSRYSRQEWLSVWARYLGLVKLLDEEVGRILKALKEEGIYEQALIVFTADHGEMLGSHSLWQKMCMYEASARVPLSIRFPSSYKTAVRKVTTPVSLVDVLPTILEFNGLPLPAGLDGRSLLAAVRSPGYNREPVFIQYDGNGSLGNYQRCVVQGNFKLIVDMFKDETFLELYDLEADPKESVNLATKKAFRSRTLEMLATVKGCMKSTGDRLTIPEDVYNQFILHYAGLSGDEK